MMLPRIILRIERWKFNKDYGVYVSTFGNFKDRYKRALPVKINKNGYCMIKTEAPNQAFKLAHRLVMLTWRPIPDSENLTVDHLNHNKRDNSLINLEWVTFEENQKRAKEDYINIDKERPKKILKLNDIPFEPNIEVIYNYLINEYYPGGYPKELIKKYIDDLISGINVSGKKKIGKKVMMTYY